MLGFSRRSQYLYSRRLWSRQEQVEATTGAGCDDVEAGAISDGELTQRDNKTHSVTHSLPNWMAIAAVALLPP